MASVMDHQMTNPMAQAWLDAANDLGIRVVHPFAFTTTGGVTVTTSGVFLPDFGSQLGTLLLCRFDPVELGDFAEEVDYFQSGLNPNSYEPYRRELYIDTLNDWGWFGAESAQPLWFTGKYWGHGGAGAVVRRSAPVDYRNASRSNFRADGTRSLPATFPATSAACPPRTP